MSAHPPLTPDAQRLGAALAERYRIERELGAGGMATVYLAHDIKHDRKVALKVLRPELAAVIGADRFIAEIRTTANLQHPHILALHDSGELDGTVFYVMPYVEGESLRDRLAREKQLPIDEAVRLTREVADALQYAHQHGVIHRDIKPENILLHGGHAQVADFGIALAASKTGGTRMTETGMSLGTPMYMSPEQAMGERTLDARADVYALGCVLYEMLTGEAPFTGPTAQAIVAKVLTEKPPRLQARRDRVPAAVEQAVLTALEKLPADRFASAAEFSRALTAEYVPAPSMARESPPHARPRVLLGAMAGFTVALAGLAAWGWLRPVASQELLQLDVSVGDFTRTDVPALSPDGMHIAYATAIGSDLYVRSLAETTAVAVVKGEDVWTPFFSPDGKSIAYLTGFPGALKVVAIAGGQTRTLVPAGTYGLGGAWSDDGWIYYSAGESYGNRLMRVRAEGGPPEPVVEPDTLKNMRLFYHPKAFPGGKKLLLTVGPVSGDASIGVLDVRAKVVTLLAKGVFASYVAPGYLVILQSDGVVLAAAFDAGSATVRSSFVPIAEGADPAGEIRAPFGVSQSGTMLFLSRGPKTQVVRVTRDGRESPLSAGWDGYFESIALSPDGKRLVVSTNTGARTELWMKILPDGPFNRLAPGVNLTHRPSWSPDGKDVLFTSDHQGLISAYRVPADGSAPPSLLVANKLSVDEATMSRDGKWLIYRVGSGTERHIFAMQLGVDSVGRALLPSSKAQEYGPSLSPDGKWLAYASSESGRDEVYIRPFPNATSAKYPVSRNGGAEPIWSHSGRELFFRQADSTFASAEIASGSTPSVSSIKVLFRTKGYHEETRHSSYEIAPDDQSFMFVKDPSASAPPRAHIIVNLAKLLSAKVGR